MALRARMVGRLGAEILRVLLGGLKGVLGRRKIREREEKTNGGSGKSSATMTVSEDELGLGLLKLVVGLRLLAVGAVDGVDGALAGGVAFWEVLALVVVEGRVFGVGVLIMVGAGLGLGLELEL